MIAARHVLWSGETLWMAVDEEDDQLIRVGRERASSRALGPVGGHIRLCHKEKRYIINDQQSKDSQRENS